MATAGLATIPAKDKKGQIDERPASSVDRGDTGFPTYEDIACRAYDLYLARECEPGHDVDDWLQAERELRGTIGLD